MDNSKRYNNYMILANDFLDQGDERRALGAFLKALEFAEEAKEEVDALFEIGDLYMYLGEYDRAEEGFRRILQLDDKASGAYYGLAILNDFKGGPMETSADFYKKAIAADPKYDRARYYLGHIYWDMGEEDKAEEQFRICLELDPYDFITYNDLGSMYERRGEYQKAKKFVRKSLDISPDYGRALFNMGVIEKALGNHKSALSYYRESIDVRPRPNIYLNMSAVYIEDRDYENALKILREGLEEFPRTVNLHYNAACALVHLNREEEAWEEISKAIAVNPDIVKWAVKDKDLKELMEKHKGGDHGHH